MMYYILSAAAILYLVIGYLFVWVLAGISPGGHANNWNKGTWKLWYFGLLWPFLGGSLLYIEIKERLMDGYPPWHPMSGMVGGVLMVIVFLLIPTLLMGWILGGSS